MKTSAKISKTETDSPVHASSPNKDKSSFFGSVNQESEMFFSPVTLQPKLKMGAPNDKYEQQADRVADAVVQTSVSKIQKQPAMEEEILQMKCKECEEEDLQLKSENGQSGGFVHHDISKKIQNAGNGSSLPDNVNRDMSTKIGADFSGVKIHTGSYSEKLNQSLGARAFTHGNNIFFNSGEYNPATTTGKHLLAHELTHVVQQEYGFINQIQRSPGSPAGGCGVCYGLPMLAGRVAHTFIQEAFQFFYPNMLSEHYILSILGEAANFNSGYLDLAILEVVDQIAIGEIKPANADGMAMGLAKLELYQTALEALGMRVRRLDYEPPPLTMQFPTLGRGPNCPPLQELEVLPAVNGVYTYTCEPDFAVIRSRCDCRQNRQRVPEPAPVSIPVSARDAALAATGTAALAGTGYIIYRGIRMLPSLYPPLWATIPANAAMP